VLTEKLDRLEMWRDWGDNELISFALGKAEPVTPDEKNVFRYASISNCNLLSSCYSNKGLKNSRRRSFFFKEFCRNLHLVFFQRLVAAMAPPGRQKMKKSSNKVFFAGWIPGINSYSDLRNILHFFKG
jgi:hypothetical protein